VGITIAITEFGVQQITAAVVTKQCIISRYSKLSVCTKFGGVVQLSWIQADERAWRAGVGVAYGLINTFVGPIGSINKSLAVVLVREEFYVHVPGQLVELFRRKKRYAFCLDARLRAAVSTYTIKKGGRWGEIEKMPLQHI
jgi:hypothetical protein